MCGIVGLFHTRSEATPDRGLLNTMNQTQHHRGPDEGGLHIEPSLGLGHRRLSIIDLASGQQPLFNEDNSVVVVYNGEIYNYQELADELAASGHIFRTRSDTEVIVHAWEEWGKSCVERFRGMFAFGLWDRNQRTLFLARDRLGIKPIYYSMLPCGQFIFGSELKALLAHSDLSRKIDLQAVEDYFAYGYVPEPKSILQDVFKLPPGHVLTLDSNTKSLPVPQKYWDISFDPLKISSPKAMEAELIERLREAVRIRLIAEVPLGAFLSGGVDSSAVVAMMAGLMDEPVRTCSVTFDNPNYDEAAYASLIARRYGTSHHVEQVNPDDFTLVDRLATFYDEPFADSSAMPTYRVCELARRQVTVALSGDGGDENFAGYRRYRWHLYENFVRNFLPSNFRKPFFGFVGQFYPKLDWAPKPLRAKSTFESLAKDSVDGYFHSVSVLGDKLRARLYHDKFRAGLQGYHAVETLRAHALQAPTDHPLSLIQYLDIKTFLVGRILTKVDRASMANSLEVRVPILDHKFVEWVSCLPPELKLHGKEGKYIFKKSLEDYVPPEILYRPKMGFSVPLASWFRGPLKNRVSEVLLGERLSSMEFFNRSFLQHLLDQHLAGLRDYSEPIWSLLMFEAFHRQVIS